MPVLAPTYWHNSIGAKCMSHFEQKRPNLAGKHQLGPAITNGQFVDILAKSAGPIWYEGLSSSVDPLGKGWGHCHM